LTGRQTCTWICFLTEEDFEDTSCVTRWKRAMKRAISSAFEGFENQILWERFVALPQAGGPIAAAEPGKHVGLQHWKNVTFLTHCAPHHETPFVWTTQQLMLEATV